MGRRSTTFAHGHRIGPGSRRSERQTKADRIPRLAGLLGLGPFGSTRSGITPPRFGRGHALAHKLLVVHSLLRPMRPCSTTYRDSPHTLVAPLHCDLQLHRTGIFPHPRRQGSCRRICNVKSEQNERARRAGPSEWTELVARHSPLHLSTSETQYSFCQCAQIHDILETP